MAYDEQLASRIRQAFDGRPDITERKMFGGLAFLCGGRMCCGIVGNDLMVRVPDEAIETVMRAPHVRPMDFTGKPMKGFVYVSPSGFRTSTALRTWLSYGEQVAEASAMTPRPARRARAAPGPPPRPAARQARRPKGGA